ncbi:MAG TPA: hypothetical protein VK837_07480 [Longimicrobiales bacterium]|nr:hypothetical protein [Longimicrobiales bacterium]
MTRPALGLGLCTVVFAAACGEAVSPTSPSLDGSYTAPAFAMSEQGELKSAEIRDGFCFFVVSDAAGFGGYSGESRWTTTSSGNTNYHCDVDLLFGGGVSRHLTFRDVTLFNEFGGLAPIFPCDVKVTPGKRGKGSVSCKLR